MRLDEKWRKEGEDITKFRECLEEMDSVTEIIPCRSVDVMVYSLLEEKEEKLSFLVLKQGNNYKRIFSEIREKGIKPLNRAFGFGDMDIEGLVSKSSLELVEELGNDVKFMLGFQGKAYFVSSAIFSTLASRLGVGGEQITVPTLARDLYVQENLDRDIPLSLVVRTGDKGEHKIFAAHSGKYSRIKQQTLCEVIDLFSPSLGASKCMWWNINHHISEVLMTFPEKAEEFKEIYKLPDYFEPGIQLSISDTGEKSLTVRGFWSFRKSAFGVSSFTRKHSGEICPEELLKEIEKEIFVKYTKVPETLAELLTIEVADPLGTIKKLVKSIGMVKAVGIKAANILRDDILGSIDPARTYTAYDIAAMFLRLPEACTGITGSAKLALENAVTGAVFAEYKTKEEEEKEDEEEGIVLLPV